MKSCGSCSRSSTPSSSRSEATTSSSASGRTAGNPSSTRASGSGMRTTDTVKLHPFLEHKVIHRFFRSTMPGYSVADEPGTCDSSDFFQILLTRTLVIIIIHNLLVSAISESSSLWCPDEPNNYLGAENSITLLYYTEESSLFCINDDPSQAIFPALCEINHREFVLLPEIWSARTQT